MSCSKAVRELLEGENAPFELVALGQESHLIVDFGIQEILPQMRILVDNNVHTQTIYSIMMMASLPKNLEILLSSLTESLSLGSHFSTPQNTKTKKKLREKNKS